MNRNSQVDQVVLSQLEFGDSLAMGDPNLMSVLPGGTAKDAVDAAADLAEGMRSLLRHMHVSVNAGELVFAAEIKTLAFITDSIHALTRASELAMARAGKDKAAPQHADLPIRGAAVEGVQ